MTALCGTQTKWRQNKSSQGKPGWSSQHGTLLLCILVFLSVAPLSGGCATMKYGSPPKIDNLPVLKTRVSGKADVIKALGEPQGHGAARFPTAPTAREIWFYEMSELVGSRMNLKILLVFFEQELYDGHLWFSSALLMDVKE
jgi:hypothetical protein